MALKVLAVIVPYLLFASKVNGQNDLKNADNRQSVLYPITYYANNVKGNQLLYSGPEYIWTYPKSIGHPYYLTDSVTTGFIHYDGVVYYNIPMQFEIVKGVLIIISPDNARIQLDNERISEFGLYNKIFKQIEIDGLPPSFYELLYAKSELQIIVERRKVVIRTGKAEELDAFKERHSFFIGKNEKYYKINNQDNLLFLLSDKQKQLEAFARKNKLSFARDPETYILKIVEYYSTI